MACSRSQHGLTRVGLELPTSGSGVRGINHQALRLRQFASWGCNSCVPDEYIEKKKRSVLIDMLHLLIRFSMIIDISHFLVAFF